MTLNTLFLPLLGGFLFYGLFNGTSHRATVQPAQVLLFWSAAIGLPLLLLTRGTIRFLQEVIGQPGPVEAWLIFAAGIPLACSIILGCFIWFATVIVRDTIIDAHKLKSVAGIVVTVLGIAYLCHFALLPEAPTQILGVDFRLYTLVIVAALTWGSQWYAKFGAIPWGAALVRISTVMVILAAAMYWLIQHQEVLIVFWQGLTKPIADSEAAAGLGSAFAAYVLGMVGAKLANIVYTKDVAEIRYVLGKSASQLERLFYHAQVTKRLILLTMDNGKVYVGTVKRVALRGNVDPYIVILPTLSGYRVNEKLTVEFTTFYQEVYKNEAEEMWDAFQKILPMQKILSAAYYDQRFHEKLSNPSATPVNAGKSS